MPFTFKSRSKQWKPSFMLSFHEMKKLHCSTSILVKPKLVNKKLPKNKTGYHRLLQKGSNEHVGILRKKVNFSSTFKTDASRSE